MSSRKIPAYHIHENGFIMPANFPMENFISALQYVPDADDIFICTYPKCGTTWTQYILHLMRSKGIPIEADCHICDVVPHIEEVGKSVVDSLQKPRIIKTHLPYDLVPKNQDAKYIYIARNPKDCCVSFYQHTKGFSGYLYQDGTFDDFFEIYLEGCVDFGDYFDNLLSWYSRKDDPNVLFVLYEDMKNDTAGSIRKFGDFLGGTFLKACEDSSVMEAVLKNSSFQSMKRTPQNWSSKRVEGSAGFIRKGEIGNWRKYFSKEQERLLDDKFRLKLRGTGAEHLWDKYDC